jgi:hypothetical protein
MTGMGPHTQAWWLPLLHQGALFVHAIAFAITLSAVIREDLHWLRGGGLGAERLARTMRTVWAGLLVLWASGLVLVAVAAAASPVPWVPSGKLAAKLVVVSLLSLNGLALHAWVFPRLLRTGSLRAEESGHLGGLPMMLGAVSSASWVFAAFIGVARPVEAVLPFGGFVALYLLSLVLALASVLAWLAWHGRVPAA